MDAKGVQAITLRNASGINHSGNSEPDRTLTKTFLIVMIPHTLNSQKHHVCTIKLISHKIRYPSPTLTSISTRLVKLFGGHSFVYTHVNSSAGRNSSEKLMDADELWRSVEEYEEHNESIKQEYRSRQRFIE